MASSVFRAGMGSIAVADAHGGFAINKNSRTPASRVGRRKMAAMAGADIVLAMGRRQFVLLSESRKNSDVKKYFWCEGYFLSSMQLSNFSLN